MRVCRANPIIELLLLQALEDTVAQQEAEQVGLSKPTTYSKVK